VADHPFGSPPRPGDALAKAAAALGPAFVLDQDPAHNRVHLRSADPDLPDVDLSLVRDRRLFSRTFPLVVEAAVVGSGPERQLELGLHRSRLRRETSLRSADEPSPEAEAWARRFADQGLLRGASTMTGVQDLRLSWEPMRSRWSLRLQTLAGALIGTAPSSAIAVGLEPEDVAGLLEVLRALRRAAFSAP
jgi:hypothetical protein